MDDDADPRERLDEEARELAAALFEVCDEFCSDALYSAGQYLREAAEDSGYVSPGARLRARTSKRRQLSRAKVREVWNRDGWECRRCGSHRNLTVDHVIPLARGGSNDLSNLQTLCDICNSAKGARE